MSEFEYAQLLTNSFNSMGLSHMNFIYIAFAYVVASFLVGKDISKTLAIGISIIYTLAVSGPFLGVIINQNSMFTVLTEYQAAFPDGVLLQAPINLTTSLIMSAGPLFIGWVASLLFLHAYVRKNKEE